MQGAKVRKSLGSYVAICFVALGVVTGLAFYLFLFVGCVSAAFSSNAPSTDTNPEEYGLSLYQSPDGDWECYLPSQPEPVEADSTNLGAFFRNATIEQWRSFSDDGYAMVIRMTGADADELISLAQNDKDACWEELEKIGTFAFIGDTGWAPVVPNAYRDEDMSVPAIDRFETEDGTSPTMEFYASYTFRNYARDVMKNGEWGVLGTYSDNAFYVLATMYDSATATRAMQKSFELIPNSGYQPSKEEKVPEGAIDWTEASQHVGETVTLYGPVVGTEYASTSNGKPTFLNIGAKYPSKDRLTITIWGKNRSAFSAPPEKLYEGKTVAVRGRVYLYDGVCNVEITSPDQITVL